MALTGIVLKPAKKAVKNALNSYVVSVCKEEYETQEFRKHNERPIEFGFVFRHLANLHPITVLDVGTGETALPSMMRTCGPEVTAIDNIKDYWEPGTFFNRHYHVIDDDITATRLTKQFDLVTCVSVLEHVKQFDDAVRNMLRLTKPGGHLIITCPYNERKYCENCYDLPNSAYGKGEKYTTQSYSRTQLDLWCEDNPVEIVEQEYWRFWDGELWTQGKQIIPGQRSSAEQAHQLTCLLLRKTA